MSFGMILWNQNMEKKHLCYLETDSCIVYMKTEDSYADVEKDAETRFDASN